MLQRVKGVIYYTMTNLRYPLSIFWTVLLAIAMLASLLSFVADSNHIWFQASIPILIFSLVIGIWSVKHIIPYLLNMSVTRKEIYLGIGISFILLAMLQAFLANLLVKLLEVFGKPVIAGMIFIEESGLETSISFEHLGQFLQSDTIYTRLIVDFILCYVALVVMFLIGLIFYRYGLLVGFSLLGISFVLYLYLIAQGSLIEFLYYVSDNYSLTLYVQFLSFGIIIYLLSFLLLRRFTVST